MIRPFLITLLAPLVMTGDGFAADERAGLTAGTAPVLPEPVSGENYSALMENSPFTRSLNLSESIILTGIARFNGKPVATLMDTKSRESYVISEVPNAQGWKLVEVSENDDLEKVVAKISVSGGEVVSVRFDEGRLKPGEGKPAAGAPDQRPEPTQDEKKRFGEIVGKKWKALSKEQQDRAKKIMGEKMRANPKMSDREKGETVLKVIDHVASQGNDRSRN